jgi:hypothetical protein
MGNLVRVDTKLYQTRYGTVFHVEPMTVWQDRQRRISGIQGGYEQLRRQFNDLAQEPSKVPRIELRRRIIHKQGRDAGPLLRIAPQLPQEHRGGGQLLLPT